MWRIKNLPRKEGMQHSCFIKLKPGHCFNIWSNSFYKKLCGYHVVVSVTVKHLDTEPNITISFFFLLMVTVQSSFLLPHDHGVTYHNYIIIEFFLSPLHCVLSYLLVLLQFIIIILFQCLSFSSYFKLI